MKIRHRILEILTPVQKVMQGIGKPEPLIQSHFVNTVVKEIQDGDLLLSREEWRLTNPFVPGFWGHAAIYFNGQVIEAVGSGVRSQDLHQWLYQKDHVCLRRAKGISREDRWELGRWCLSQCGKGYDYSFTEGVKAFYCSELFVLSYEMVSPDWAKFPDDIITPEDLFNSSLLETLANSNEGE